MDNYDEDVVEETTTEETSPEVEDGSVEEESEAEEVDYKAEFEKTKAELEKAQRAIEKNKQKAKTSTAATEGLSTADILALSKADVDTEDLDEVLDYAKYKKISISEALKSSVLKNTLQERIEQRKSAEAVTTKGTRRAASSQVSDDRLLADAQNGIFPDREEDIARLAKLHILKR